MPIQLWSLSYDTKYITNFIKKISVNDKKIGIVCSYGNFENNDQDNAVFGSLLNDIEKSELSEKLEFSEEQFYNDYPTNMNQIINESAEINVI